MKSVGLFLNYTPLPNNKVNLKITPLVRVSVAHSTYYQFKTDQIVHWIDKYISKGMVTL